MLMLESDQLLAAEMMLSNADYPEGFHNKRHPDDGKETRYPIVPEPIFNRKAFHNRIFLRISFQLSSNKYVPFTFVCDTGAPNFIYLSDLPSQILSKRIKTDPDTNVRYMMSNGRKILVENTPDHHNGVNILGLLILSRWGLSLQDDQLFFTNLPEFV